MQSILMKKNYTIFVLSALIFFGFQFSAAAQLLEEDDDYNKGVTVSPSHLQFNVDLGKTKTQKVKVSNFTDAVQKFKVVYQDFDITNDGNSQFLEAGSSDYSLKKHIQISPTFIEVAPNSMAEIDLTVTLPNEPEANAASWGVLMIEQMEEKKVLDPGSASENAVAFGITPTFAFGVWLYQNPPNVENMRVDITNFIFEKKINNNMLFLKVKNKGDGISFCNAYVEITNLTTGEQSQLGGKRYTILPGYRRTFIFDLTENLPKGSYSAVGVLDYNSDDELVAAELEFKVD